VTLAAISSNVKVQFSWSVTQMFGISAKFHYWLLHYFHYFRGQGHGSRSKPPYWKSSTCNSAAVVYDIFIKFGNNFGMKYDSRQNWRWGLMEVCTLCVFSIAKEAITSKIKHAIKHKTSPARLAQLLQPSLACSQWRRTVQSYTVRRHWLKAKTKC